MRKNDLVLLLSAFALLPYTFNGRPAVSFKDVSHALVLPVTAKNDGEAKGLLNRSNFEDSVRQLYDHIRLDAYGLDYKIFRMGIVGYHSLRHEGALNDKSILTIIDFSKPSTEKRFYTIDLKDLTLLYHTYVAHGRNTGEDLAKEFSNKPHSNQSSLGFYVTGETYIGSKGYSLRLDGKEKNYNDNIRRRAVVMHEADYVSENWVRRYGRLGRSQGCPALPKKVSREVINTIKNKTAIFTYFPDDDYIRSSRYLDVDRLMNVLDTGNLELADQQS
jgi:hypothetical protein